tara:strand:- start:4121 stop:5005 length:885 start_codon:yes stop_codon:yes gene_type:complete
MTTYTSYNQVGLKENVDDLISNISPFATPMQAMIKNEKVNARTFSFLEDSLADSMVNAQVEGSDASMMTLTDATERTNNTQIMSKAFQISATADAVATYGRAKETALQLAKKLKEIKKDYEHAMVGVTQASVAGSASTARKMTSLLNQITTNVDAGGGSADALTEAKLLEAGQTAYDNNSDVDTFMIKPADAQIVAGFSAAAGRNREINQGKTLVNAIDIYVSPYGTYRVVLNRELKTDHALLIDPTMFKACTLRPFTRTLLAKSGDSDKHLVIGEVSCKHTNFGDSVKITGLS